MSTLRRIAALPAGHRTKWATLLAVVAVLVLAGPLAGKVGDVEENGPTSQLPRGADSTWVEDQLPAFAQDEIQPTAVVYVRDGGLTDTDREAITTDRQALAEYAAGQRVDPARFAGDDNAAVVTFGMDFSEAAGGFDLVPEVRNQVDAGLPDGLEAKVTGPSAAMYDAVSVFDGVDTTILAASASVVAILLLLTYRSPVMWLLPLLSIGVAATLSEAVVYLLAKHAGLPVDGQSGGVLPIMVFGVGTDYALLLIARYREELHTHTDRHRAMRNALRKAGPAVLASAATVVLGMGCLMIADMNSTRSLGAVCAVGVACAAVAMLVVLPMMLVLAGRWVFWPFIPHAGTEHRPARRSPWHRVAAGVARAPRQVWVSSGGALAVLAVAVVGLDVGTTAEESFRTTPESVIGQRMLSEHFAGGSAAPVEIVADTSTADEAARVARTSPGVAEVTAPVTSPDGTQVLLTAVLEDAPDSADAREAVSVLRDSFTGIDGPPVRVGGPTAQSLDVANASSSDALKVIPVVLAVVLFVLIALLRAVVGPLVLLGSVVLSYAAALGAGGLAMRAMGFEAVEVSLPLLAFVFLVALGVDYTIFLMSRVREEVVDRGPVEGVRRGLVTTGGVITSAGLVLAATFSILAVMPIVFMIGMGVVVALGILLDTFVVRSLLVPGLAIDLGRRFWVPSHLGRDAADPVSATEPDHRKRPVSP